MPALLAVWVYVLGCGTSITHAHESHGELHRHLILFGVEVPGDLPPSQASQGQAMLDEDCDPPAVLLIAFPVVEAICG